MKRLVVDGRLTGNVDPNYTRSLIEILRDARGNFIETDSRLYIVSVKDFGALGDGVTTDTAGIQAALDAARLAGGGWVFVPAGTYLIDQSVKIGSKTRLYGEGAASIIKAHQSSYVGVNTGTDSTTNCQLIRNYNHSASSLTDTDITIENLAFEWGTVTISGGGAHSVSLRYVDRLTLSGCYSNKGENFAAIRASRDSLIFNCHAVDWTNAAFDHWQATGNARVISCTGRCSVNTAQGIQLNTSPGASVVYVAAFNSLYGVRNSSSHSAVALAFGSTGGGGSDKIARVRSYGNYVEDSDVGLAFSGDVDHCESAHDTFYNCDQLPIIFVDQGGGIGAPTDCQVIHPHLIDCDHTVSNVALVAFTGTRNSVRGLKVSNSGAAPYDTIAWIASGTDNAIDIYDAPTGGGARISDSGTTTKISDTFNTYDSGSYNGTLAFGGGSTGITYSARTINWRRIGKRCYLNGAIVLTNKGSSTGTATVSLPFTAASIGPAGSALLPAFSLTGLTATPFGYVGSGATTLTLKDCSATADTVLDDTNFANASYVYIDGSYETT